MNLLCQAKKCRTKDDFKNLLIQKSIPFENKDIDDLFNYVQDLKNKKELDLDELESVSGGKSKKVVVEGKVIEYYESYNQKNYTVH